MNLEALKGFNSTLVQLKGAVQSVMCWQKTGFNSTLVQLKESMSKQRDIMS